MTNKREETAVTDDLRGLKNTIIGRFRGEIDRDLSPNSALISNIDTCQSREGLAQLAQMWEASNSPAERCAAPIIRAELGIGKA